MDRYVVMVDAGYLLRQAVEIISAKTSSSRSELDITDPQGLIDAILAKSKSALALTNKELLRVYWYDGVSPTGLTSQQKLIMELPDVQFRAGTINSAKQQKGVDSLIVTDLIELTAHHAICDAILVTGDSDLAIGIEIAQKKGVRIAVLGIEDLSVGVSHKQSFEITSRADRVARIGGNELTPLMRHVKGKSTLPKQKTPSSPVEVASPATKATIAATKSVSTGPIKIDEEKLIKYIQEFIGLQATLADAIDPSTKRIETNIDRALLYFLFTKLERVLTAREKIAIRDIFRKELS